MCLMYLYVTNYTKSVGGAVAAALLIDPGPTRLLITLRKQTGGCNRK